MRVLGIDPGINGALASWDGESLVVMGVPSYEGRGRGRTVDATALADDATLLFSNCDHAFVEDVNTRPSEGRSAAFKFGTVYGELLMLVTGVLRLPRTMVTPAKWKPRMGVKADKADAVGRARELWPRSAHLFVGPKGGPKDGVAEAALIAYYGRQQLMEKK